MYFRRGLMNFARATSSASFARQSFVNTGRAGSRRLIVTSTKFTNRKSKPPEVER